MHIVSPTYLVFVVHPWFSIFCQDFVFTYELFQSVFLLNIQHSSKTSRFFSRSHKLQVLCMLHHQPSGLQLLRLRPWMYTLCMPLLFHILCSSTSKYLMAPTSLWAKCVRNRMRQSFPSHIFFLFSTFECPLNLYPADH
jgi:hypothetical protein